MKLEWKKAKKAFQTGYSTKFNIFLRFFFKFKSNRSHLIATIQFMNCGVFVELHSFSWIDFIYFTKLVVFWVYRWIKDNFFILIMNREHYFIFSISNGYCPLDFLLLDDPRKNLKISINFITETMNQQKWKRIFEGMDSFCEMNVVGCWRCM